MEAVIIARNSLPLLVGSGESVYLSTFVNHLLTNGHKVNLISYDFDFELWGKRLACSKESEIKVYLSGLGISAYLNFQLPSPVLGKLKKLDFFAHALWPKPEYYYKGYQYSAWVTKTLKIIKPDIVFAYMVDTLASVQEYRAREKFILASLITDLDHVVRSYRQKFSTQNIFKREFSKIRNSVANRALSTYEIELLKKCDKVCSSAYHHQEWLKRKGIKNIDYFPVPVQDCAPVGQNNSPEQNHQKHQNLYIDLIGNVTGLATLSGLWYFNDQIIPKFDQQKKNMNYKFRIIGSGDLDPRLVRSFSRYPWVEIVGFSEKINEEYNQAAIILVPTPISSGFRTRIAEAFSYGCCVITHKANSLGMPELENGKNVLLAETGEEFVQAINKCLNDPGLRENLGREARVTFEQKYRGDLVVENMLKFCLT